MFHLIDLQSQAVVVQQLLRGRSFVEKIRWLKAHGLIEVKPKTIEGEHQVFFFTSTMNRECIFFIEGDEFVFIGDHTTFTSPSGQ